MQRHDAINNSIDVITPFRIASCWTISNTQPIWWQVKRLTSTSTPTDHSCSTNARSALPLRYGTIMPFGSITIIRSPTASAHDPPAPNHRASELPNSHSHCPTRLVGLWYQNEAILVTSITMEYCLVNATAPQFFRVLKKRAVSYENILDVRAEITALEVLEGEVRGFLII